jgi:hypothetical protein
MLHFKSRSQSCSICCAARFPYTPSLFRDLFPIPSVCRGLSLMQRPWQSITMKCSSGNVASSSRSPRPPPPPPPPPAAPPPNGFQSDSSSVGGHIVFLSPINTSDYFDNFDYSDYEPVTELTDQQLLAHGFPVATEANAASTADYDEDGAGHGERSPYPGPVIDSPFIHFTSRESL